MLSSNTHQTNSHDLLTHQSEQTILTICSFLDLTSLENLQLTNRRMRQLFTTSLWRNLTILTFQVPILRSNQSPHKIFRRRWFQRYPDELDEFRRTRYFQLVITAMHEAAIQYRRPTIEEQTEEWENRIRRRLRLHLKLQKLERIMLIGLSVLLMVCLYYSQDCYTYSEGCEVEYSDRMAECSENCRDYSNVQLFTVIFALITWVFSLVYEMKYGRIDTAKKLKCQCWRSLLKTILVIGAIIYYLKAYYGLLSNSKCGGFLGEIDLSLCVITANFGLTSFFVIAMAFIPFAILYFLSFCVEINAGINSTCTYGSSITRPLLE